MVHKSINCIIAGWFASRSVGIMVMTDALPVDQPTSTVPAGIRNSRLSASGVSLKYLFPRGERRFNHAL